MISSLHANARLCVESAWKKGESSDGNDGAVERVRAEIGYAKRNENEVRGEETEKDGDNVCHWNTFPYPRTTRISTRSSAVSVRDPSRIVIARLPTTNGFTDEFLLYKA